jgi:hypothetical protein
MRREYLWALLTLVVAIALAVFLLSVAAEDESQGQPVPPIQHSEYDQRLDRLDRKGVEAAYVTRVGLLFQNWMTDTTEQSQERAQRGHRNARNIYIKVMKGLDARNDEAAADGFKLQSDTSTPVVLPAR